MAGLAAAEVAVRAPDGSRYATHPLETDRVTVGRLPDVNDISLEPDPDRLVTRQEHFSFQQVGTDWLVVDAGSMNGTFLRRDGELQRVAGTAALVDGDVVLVIGAVRGTTVLSYWEFEFGDRARTRPVNVADVAGRLSYDLEAAQLYVVVGERQHAVPLRRQAHQLVRFMAVQNLEAGKAVLCSHDDLMTAVWGDEPLHTREELNRLFWEIRTKLQLYGLEHLVESVRGLGYRIRTN